MEKSPLMSTITACQLLISTDISSQRTGGWSPEGAEWRQQLLMRCHTGTCCSLTRDQNTFGLLISSSLLWRERHIQSLTLFFPLRGDLLQVFPLKTVEHNMGELIRDVDFGGLNVSKSITGSCYCYLKQSDNCLEQQNYRFGPDHIHTICWMNWLY